MLVRAFDGAGAKSERARALLRDLWMSGRGCVSLPVLEEFFLAVTREAPRPMSVREAAYEIEDFSRWLLHCPDAEDLLAAIELAEVSSLSLRDAMVVQSARRLRCRTLWTEALEDGRAYAGVLARSPFRDSLAEYALYPQRNATESAQRNEIAVNARERREVKEEVRS